MEEEHSSPVRIIVKKNRAHGGHHGGAWKVAYADFVTAMMALFIVLWILGQTAEVREAISRYFKDPGVFTGSRSGGVLQGGGSKPLLFAPPLRQPEPAPDKLPDDMERLKAEARSIQEKISSVPDFSKFKDKIEVMVTPEGLRIDLVEISEGLFFDIGKAILKPETVRLLKLVASHLKTLPNKVVVEGYTDARPYVAPGYSNWDLSVDRANSARKVLEDSGLRKNQIAEVRGFADKSLRVPERPLDYANRRVSILVAARGAASALYEAPRPRPGPPKPFGENEMPHRQGL
jgi:chemotaxis protein MotB